MIGLIWRYVWSMCLAGLATGSVACIPSGNEMQVTISGDKTSELTIEGPRGGRLFFGHDTIAVEDWIGVIRLDELEWPEVVFILPDGVEIENDTKYPMKGLFWTDSLPSEYWIDGMKVQFSGYIEDESSSNELITDDTTNIQAWTFKGKTEGMEIKIWVDDDTLDIPHGEYEYGGHLTGCCLKLKVTEIKALNE